ncbi:MAG TPA: FtsX-like permease family protein [Solirubrobacteraceae bacterium]|jgi:putative ABC transport system permease protein|nr:FtsX-like permease family protein [Solirubrobacteraceae bacterium]
MRPYALLFLYRRRLRVHAVQELLAGVGIAIAVALVFAALVAEGSIAGSAGEVVHAVVGPANLQLRSRDGEGFDERLLAKVERLPGVKQAAPLLEQTATIVASDGRRISVDVAGTVTSLAVLNGLAHTLPLAALSPGGIGISRASAEAFGANGSSAYVGEAVSLRLRGLASPLKISAVLGPEAAGALSRALVAVMPLARMQQLARLQGRITRILVQAQPGAQSAVRAELERIAGGRLEVAPAYEDVASLRQALRPSDQASELFAAIGALLGFLLAFNAMLLTVPERRQAIADLRIAGTRRAAIIQMVLFQALCLGLLASLAGLLIGYLLSVGVFHQSSAYLAAAFTLGRGTVIGAKPPLLAAGGGVLVTCLASATVLLDLSRRRTRDAVYMESGAPGNAVAAGTRRRMFAGAVGLFVLATALFAATPSAALAATAVLAVATVLAVPLVLAGVLRALGAFAVRNQRLTTLPVALASLRGTALRSLALAATGAVALFGSVALGGSRENLLKGIAGFAHSYVADAQVWVSNPDDNDQATNAFVAGDDAARIARVPGVASVRSFAGGFLQLNARRVWVIARPPGASREVLESQIVEGRAPLASRRLGEGGWITVSQQIAREHHVNLGDALALPTPSGERRFRIAATTTNLAWPPGVIFMSTADYGRAWRTSAPTAFGIDLRPGADPTTTRSAIQRALGPGSGLQVSLPSARERRIDALTSEGLGQLGEISTLLLLAAVSAMAAALGSSIWQRRPWLAGLRLSGAQPRRLRRIMLTEAALMLGAGCLTGALAGVYGQVVIDAYLQRVTGFPLARSLTGVRPLEILALVVGLALAIVAVPGWFASRVSPALALEEG